MIFLDPTVRNKSDGPNTWIIIGIIASIITGTIFVCVLLILIVAYCRANNSQNAE